MENAEVWKDIKGYEGLYQISNCGRVWSVRKQRYIDTWDKGNGYMAILLTAKNGKRNNELLHRLLALTFIDNPNNYPVVDHIDGDPHNNSLQNLRWATHKQNSNNPIAIERMRYSSRIIGVNQLSTNGTLIRSFRSINEAERETGISSSNICKVCKG